MQKGLKMTKSTKKESEKKLQDIEERIMDLTTPEIFKYESKHPSLLEGINNFSSYAKIGEYRPIINELSALLKEDYCNDHITVPLIGIMEKYLNILESASSVIFALANFNHIVAACLMFYIQKFQSGDFEKYINKQRGVLTSGMLSVAEATDEYIHNVDWSGIELESEDFEFSDDAPLYNKMLNIILENNHFADIQEYFPDYNHDCAWKEILKNLEWISEESQFWCNVDTDAEQE